jgi:hypothetical protein
LYGVTSKGKGIITYALHFGAIVIIIKRKINFGLISLVFTFEIDAKNVMLADVSAVNVKLYKFETANINANFKCADVPGSGNYMCLLL